MSESKKVKLSKFLSLVLRHQPDRLGLVLDEAGWVDVQTLLDAMKKDGRSVSLQELKEVVQTNDKQRFKFSDDGLKIRASQGHSVQVELGLPPVTPPEFLYHGTAVQTVPSIRKTGLEKLKRQHVHLSPDQATALKVGQRHGRPVILVVRAGEMQQAGHEFFLSANGVWLTDAVPVAFLDFPPE